MRDTVISILACAIASLPLAACTSDDDVERSELLEELTREIADAEIEIEDAIEIAQSEAPDATVFSAELVWIGEETNYDVDLLDGDAMLEIDVAAADGRILRAQRREPSPEELAIREAGAALVDESDGWSLIVQSAEVAVTGVAFEARARPDIERLEVQLLAPDGIWAVSTRSDGTEVRAARVDSSDWELGEPGVPDSDPEVIL